jgi:hypothetical protein
MNKDSALGALFTPARNLFYWATRVLFWVPLALPVLIMSWMLNPPIWAVVMVGLWMGSLWVLTGFLINSQFALNVFQQFFKRVVLLRVAHPELTESVFALNERYDDDAVERFFVDKEFREHLITNSSWKEQ